MRNLLETAPEWIQRKDCDLNNLFALPPFRLCLFCYSKNMSEQRTLHKLINDTLCFVCVNIVKLI